jgi:hypothetical protein
MLHIKCVPCYEVLLFSFLFRNITVKFYPFFKWIIPNFIEKIYTAYQSYNPGYANLEGLLEGRLRVVAAAAAADQAGLADSADI